MKTVWTNHIQDQDEKVQFQKGLLNTKWVLNRLNEILESIDRGLDKQELSPKAYDSPNWDYRQAHSNGYRQCLRTIKELINLDQKENLSD